MRFTLTSFILNLLLQISLYIKSVKMSHYDPWFLRNKRFVEHQMAQKAGYLPYYQNQAVGRVMTDMDHFPYTRYFRGIYYLDEPVVMDREAGYREMESYKYFRDPPDEPCPYPTHCFQVPCSTILPCRPRYQYDNADINSLSILQKKGCIVNTR